MHEISKHVDVYEFRIVEQTVEWTITKKQIILRMNPHRFCQNLLAVMLNILSCAAIVLILSVVIVRDTRKAKCRRQIAALTILPEELHALQETHSKVLILDVREPLDFLADAEVIPGAVRIALREVIANPSLIPTDSETVAYCTCPGKETSRKILQWVLRTGHSRMRFLKGGLAAWKAKGYPVEPYRHQFHLDNAS